MQIAPTCVTVILITENVQYVACIAITAIEIYSTCITVILIIADDDLVICMAVFLIYAQGDLR